MLSDAILLSRLCRNGVGRQRMGWWNKAKTLHLHSFKDLVMTLESHIQRQVRTVPTNVEEWSSWVQAKRTIPKVKGQSCRKLFDRLCVNNNKKQMKNLIFTIMMLLITLAIGGDSGCPWIYCPSGQYFDYTTCECEWDNDASTNLTEQWKQICMSSQISQFNSTCQ